MWCYIKHENVEEFITQYPELYDTFESLILLETKDVYFLPRYIYLRFPSKLLVVYQGKDIAVPYDTIDLKFKGKLRPEQVPIMNYLMDIYKYNRAIAGILKARPGIGKTVMSTYLTTKLGFKTLIVVDNSNLLKQWVNAYYQFTDLTAKDISIFKQTLFETETPVTIAMIQTLTRRLKNDIKKTYDIINNNKFGFIIYDEVHNTSSATEFAKGSLLFRTKNILGLSATPFQTGVSELLMTYTIGDIIYETSDYDLIPEFKFVLYNSDLEDKYKYVINKSQDYKIKKAVYNKAIINSDTYLEAIVDYTKKLLSDNHKIMILCFTKKQVETISNLLTNKNIQNTMFYGNQKNINYDEQILVATYSFAGKGFDYAELSAMILVCPLAGKKSIIQTVGRILRKSENKTPPVVIDLIDMSLPHMFLRELKIKKSIVKNEFKCKITEENYE